MNSDLKRFLLWFAVSVIIIGSFLALMFMSGGKSGSIKLVGEVTTDEWIKGNKDAKVTLVEYSDFQCPACLSRQPLLKDIVAEFGNHMRLVYRHFPLRSLHKNSQMAAQAAEAAGLQGKFWEMHDKLFENQAAWSKQDASAVKTAFALYANQFGLDIGKFNKDLESSEVVNLVNEDFDGGEEAKIDSTPTFFLNGQEIQVNPSDYESFRKLIRDAVEANS